MRAQRQVTTDRAARSATDRTDWTAQTLEEAGGKQNLPPWRRDRNLAGASCASALAEKSNLAVTALLQRGADREKAS
jgi:hypothetical protein